MAETRNNLRTAVVVVLACLTCVFFGYLMGMTASRPQRPVAQAEKADDAEHVIRPAAIIDASKFNAVSSNLMNSPDAKHRSVQGMPLKMVMMKFASILRSELTKHDTALLEKKMMDVSEAVFSDFTNVIQDDIDRFKFELYPLLEFLSDKGSSDPDLNCVFGVSEDGGKTISEIVLILTHSNLQIVRFIGDHMDPSVIDLLVGRSAE